MNQEEDAARELASRVSDTLKRCKVKLEDLTTTFENNISSDDHQLKYAEDAEEIANDLLSSIATGIMILG